MRCRLGVKVGGALIMVVAKGGGRAECGLRVCDEWTLLMVCWRQNVMLVSS